MEWKMKNEMAWNILMGNKIGNWMANIITDKIGKIIRNGIKNVRNGI